MNPPSTLASAHPQSTFVSSLQVGEKSALVQTIYSKHVAELQALEEAQQKLILLLLGIFGAGASFLASDKTPVPSLQACWGLTLVVLGMIAVGWRYTKRRDHARQSVRELLTDCEKALGLFDAGVFLPNVALYPRALMGYPKQGYWLSYTFWIAAIAAGGFLIVLWAPHVWGVKPG